MAKKKVTLKLPNDAKFIPVPGSHLTKAQAAKLGPILVKLTNDLGGFNREVVYDLARDPKSPLHDVIFCCDEDTAAERYYMGRVNWLARSILVDYKDTTTGMRERVQLFHLVRPRAVTVVTPEGEGVDPESGEALEASAASRYINWAQATDDPQVMQQLLREADVTAKRFRARFNILKRVGPGFKGKHRKLWNGIKDMF